jgi:NAD(P)-dependent dehydrogenase (short-subunit alcohol dehydrogenase family)
MLRRAPRLDVLVNNAGRGQFQRKLTAEGFEETFAVNHLAPFLLTNLLLPRLKDSAPARIVIVASSSHHRGRIDFDNLNAERGYQIYRAYSQSKLANLLFMRALIPRLDGTNVTVNAVHPGVVRTGIGMDRLPLLARGFAHLFVHPFLLSAKQGAQTGVYLARAPELENISGRYFIKCKPAPRAAHAEDDTTAEKLWAVSERMCGLA